MFIARIDDAHDGEGVATDGEEVVVNTDGRCIQNLLPDLLEGSSVEVPDASNWAVSEATFGRALVSSSPLAVSGNSARTQKAEGIMYSGKWAVEIVDLFHARQHLWSLALLLHPADLPCQKRWMTRHQPKLDGGRIEQLVSFLRHLDASRPDLAEIIRTEAAYVERNAERMALA